MDTEFLGGTVTLPTPFMTEECRLARLEEERQKLRAMGMMIISERRVRNPAFDKKGERTTFNITIKPSFSG